MEKLSLLNLIVLSLSCFVSFDSYGVDAISQPSYPVLFIPGDGGAKIYGKLDHFDGSWFCESNSDWSTWWLDYEPFVNPPSFTCFVERIKLVYNETSGTYSNVKGVLTKVDALGATTGCDYLDKFHFITYFGKMMKHLTEDRGYNSTNMKAYSFDWRYTPVRNTEPDGEYASIKFLIEQLYSQNQNKKVVVVTHSLGGVLFQAYLENAAQSWKDKYIYNWVSIGTPLFGAAQSVASFSSGYNLDSFIVPNFKLREALQTWPSTAWLIPMQKFWNNLPIVSTPTQNFTAKWSDIESFFDAIKLPLGKTMFKQVRTLIKFTPPQVNISCVYGSQLKTPAQFYYPKGLPDDYNADPEVTYGDGDGTVNIKSGKACLMWVGQQENRVTDHEMKGVEHVDLLSNDGVIAIVDSVLGYSSIN